ncbi:hypothetical protein F443_12411 [Phytophthora nicotianae P1569]|uniref:Uncharacterized protein n=1 Tax=Phytophthora nicotianae P1569 TaxID=1317065 RepID=V9EVF7_PHYNI|nr:hypothetical protein F443_12411 [Phytophthora nicotianae P1569]
MDILDKARKKAVYVGEYSDSFDLIARRIQVTDRDLSKELFHEASGVLKLTGARTFEFTDVFGVVTEFMVPSVHSQETRIIKVGCTQGDENRPKNLTNRSGKLTPKQLPSSSKSSTMDPVCTVGSAVKISAYETARNKFVK